MIGDRIKLVRKRLGASQRNFAAALGISNAYVSQLEKGQYTPSEQLILSICRGFNVRREWLETGKGEPWGENAPSAKGHEMIDELATRAWMGRSQVSTPTLARLGGIDVDFFSRGSSREIRFASDDISLAVDMLASIFAEGDKTKMDTVMSLLKALLTGKNAEQARIASTHEAIRREARRDIAFARRSEKAGSYGAARDAYRRAVESYKRLMDAGENKEDF
jgi:transcriptional regulator with XRE-family HTH domain